MAMEHPEINPSMAGGEDDGCLSSKPPLHGDSGFLYVREPRCT